MYEELNAIALYYLVHSRNKFIVSRRVYPDSYSILEIVDSDVVHFPEHAPSSCIMTIHHHHAASSMMLHDHDA